MPALKDDKIEKLNALEIVNLIVQSKDLRAHHGTTCEVVCKNCRKVLVTSAIVIGGRILCPSDLVCSDCVLKHDDEETARRWRNICPPLFHDTDSKRLLPAIVMVSKNWLKGDRRLGLGLVGTNRIGKTRAMWQIRKKLFGEGAKTEFTTMAEFARVCSDRFADGATADTATWSMHKFKKTSFLFLDDIGKERMTERVQADFLELVDTRMRECLPIIWSSNNAGLKMTDRAQGDPSIMLRLRECCEVKDFS